MKRFLFCAVFLLAALASVLTPCLQAAEGAEKEYNWYVIRNKEHKQPIFSRAQKETEKYGAYSIDLLHGDGCDEKTVYLTFDAGYENGNIAKILDILKKEETPAAFFILKHLISKEPELVGRMAEEGHLVCNHTMNHKDMTVCSEKEFTDELNGLAALYKNTYGREMAKYYRPPEGKYSIKNLQMAKELGYTTVFWSFAYADWDNGAQPEPEAAKRKILENMHNGAVLLLHPTSATNAAILQDVIRELKAEGYRFATLDELTGKCANA